MGHMGRMRRTPWVPLSHCTSLAVLLALALLLPRACDAKPCPRVCQVAGYMSAPWNLTSLGAAKSSHTCAMMAQPKGFKYYAFRAPTGTCFGIQHCDFVWPNARYVMGLASACPKPPSPVGYCSSPTRKGCRACRYPFKCRSAGSNKKVCCCPADKPHPVIKKGKLHGCKS